MLFAPEALIIVAFAFEQLLEVRFAVKFTLKSCKAAKAARSEVRKYINIKYKPKKSGVDEESQVQTQENGSYI